ncbi:MAG TPA: DUF4065 domain-containing protein [Candidatus Absconditabacterales bacterium]|nr:DUF4065 domain-containing protein [Candidatus Absconditabacterales bacterium]
MDYSIIKKLRKKNNWTQDQVAEMLGISRVTYNLLENGKTPRTPYIKSLQDIFDISFSALQNNKKIKHKTLNDRQYKKIKNLILYILNKTSSLPNVGKTVIYKILYFCEFDRYELTGERLTGLDFIKLPKGPAPENFDFIINRMEKEESIISITAKYMGYIQQRYIINEKVADNLLEGEQKTHVNKVIEKFKNMNASEISEYSHGDIPWKATPDMEIIDINLANHRLYPYSAKIREKKIEQDTNNFTNNPAFQFLLDEEDLYEDIV